MAKGRCLCGALRYELMPVDAMMHCTARCAASSTAPVSPLSSSRRSPAPAGVRVKTGWCAISRRRTACAHSAACAAGRAFDAARTRHRFRAGGEPGRRSRHQTREPSLRWVEGAVGRDHRRTAAAPDLPARLRCRTRPRPAVTPRAGITEGSCLCGGVASRSPGACAHDELPLRPLPPRRRRGARHQRLLPARPVPLGARRSARDRIQAARCASTRRRFARAAAPAAPAIAGTRYRRGAGGFARHGPGHARAGAHLRCRQGAMVRHHGPVPQFAQMPPA